MHDRDDEPDDAGHRGPAVQRIDKQRGDASVQRRHHERIRRWRPFADRGHREPVRRLRRWRDVRLRPRPGLDHRRRYHPVQRLRERRQPGGADLHRERDDVPRSQRHGEPVQRLRERGRLPRHLLGHDRERGGGWGHTRTDRDTGPDRWRGDTEAHAPWHAARDGHAAGDRHCRARCGRRRGARDPVRRLRGARDRPSIGQGEASRLTRRLSRAAGTGVAARSGRHDRRSRRPAWPGYRDASPGRATPAWPGGASG